MKIKIIITLIQDWVNQVIIKNYKCINATKFLDKLDTLDKLMK